MTNDDAVLAANRAANAVMMLPRHQSWIAECFGWKVENKRDGVEYAATYVRTQPEAPAEALYIEMRSAQSPVWEEAKPLVRVAVEVFVGTLRCCDKLVPPAPLAARAGGGWLTEHDDEMADGMDERL